MEAMRFVRRVEGEKITLTNLGALKGKTVELIILPIEEDEEKEWFYLSASGLSAAYSEEEPEYTLDEVSERNPKYEDR